MASYSNPSLARQRLGRWRTADSRNFRNSLNMKLAFTGLAVASGIGCWLLMLLLINSRFLELWGHGLRIKPHFHVEISDGVVWFYSDELRRPQLVPPGSPFPGPPKRSIRFPGFMYDVSDNEGRSFWHLMIGLEYPILLLAIPPTTLWAFHRRRN